MSINSGSMPKKSMVKVISILPPHTFPQQLQGQNTSVEIELIENMDLSDTLNYQPFFKNCISKAILQVL